MCRPRRCDADERHRSATLSVSQFLVHHTTGLSAPPFHRTPGHLVSCSPYWCQTAGLPAPPFHQSLSEFLVYPTGITQLTSLPFRVIHVKKRIRSDEWYYLVGSVLLVPVNALTLFVRHCTWPSLELLLKRRLTRRLIKHEPKK